jgi:hypothetical protein
MSEHAVPSQTTTFPFLWSEDQLSTAVSLTELYEQCSLALDSSEGLQSRLRAVQHDPTDPLPLYSLARFCRRHGFLSLWRRAVDTALSLPHRSQEQLWSRGDVRLTLGDWLGWSDREVRFFNPTSNYFHSKYARGFIWTKQAWDASEDLSDKTLFVIADGGFGDCIQMLRFLPDLVARAQHVIIAVRAGLESFIRHNFQSPVTVVLRDRDHGLPFQRYTWAMSLPALQGRLPTFIPMMAPILKSRPRVSSERLRIGLCWAGSSCNPTDHRRSVPISVLEPLLSRDDIQWLSLQVGDRAGDVAPYAHLIEPSSHLHTFADTANVISTLDGVITVDTSVAHLAGSLGIPTFLMLSFVSEFRWGLRASTEWYPTVRLIRQTVPGDWSAVARELMVELDARDWVTI